MCFMFIFCPICAEMGIFEACFLPQEARGARRHKKLDGPPWCGAAGAMIDRCLHNAMALHKKVDQNEPVWAPRTPSPIPRAQGPTGMAAIHSLPMAGWWSSHCGPPPRRGKAGVSGERLKIGTHSAASARRRLWGCEQRSLWSSLI